VPPWRSVCRSAKVPKIIEEGARVVERSEAPIWSAELYRLRGVLLAAMGADETEIEASFCEAIRIAKEQASPKDRASFDSWIAALTFAKLG
jgi:hypothetical protein